MIRVIIADDQPIIQDGLKFIIEQDPDIQVIGCAKNGYEAFLLCKELDPDIVLMDIKMPGYSGIDGLQLIKNREKSTKVIMLTTFEDIENVRQAVKYGADGYILKDIATDELIMTIKGSAAGLSIINGKTFSNLISHLERQTPGQNTSPMGLTSRETAILKLLVYGRSNKEIASDLDLSEGGVRNAISGMLNKLDLRDRTQLAVFAVKNNLF